MEYSLQLRNKRFILTRNYSDGNNQMCRSAVFWGQEKMVTLRVSDNTGPACHHSTEESDDRSYRMENAEVPVSSDIWRKISFKQTCVQNTKKTLGMTLNLRVGGVSIVSIFAEKLKVSEVWTSKLTQQSNLSYFRWWNQTRSPHHHILCRKIFNLQVLISCLLRLSSVSWSEWDNRLNPLQRQQIKFSGGRCLVDLGLPCEICDVGLCSSLFYHRLGILWLDVRSSGVGSLHRFLPPAFKAVGFWKGAHQKFPRLLLLNMMTAVACSTSHAVHLADCRRGCLNEVIWQIGSTVHIFHCFCGGIAFQSHCDAVQTTWETAIT